MINVTKTYLPPIEDYIDYLKKIWKSGWVTNNGSLLVELEKRLKEYLGVKHLFIVSNGTIGLQISYKALKIDGGEVITTPFSYVATSSSLIWEDCQPVFADIDKNTLNIDPKEIEKKITKKTKAIVAVHVYGNPCDVQKIEKISKKHNIPVIYDAAHAFGVKYNNDSILNFGNISVLSFHATKLFHSVEGGAIITNDDELAHKVSYMRNFGHNGQEKFWGLAINGKNSEFHAAMGLSVLKHFDYLVDSRKKVTQSYDKLLDLKKLKKPIMNENIIYNYAYYPIIFDNEEILLKTLKELNNEKIYPRRYFFPSLNKINYIKENFGYQKMSIAEEVSTRILSLPLSHDLSTDEIEKISTIINTNI